MNWQIGDPRENIYDEYKPVELEIKVDTNEPCKYIRFKTEEEAYAFAKKLNLKTTEYTVTTWFA